MRILHISTEKGYRGGERQLAYIHRGILESDEESFILCNEVNQELLNETNTDSFSLRGIKGAIAPLAVLGYIKKCQPDVVHCHDSRALTLLALISSFHSIPTVFSRKTVFPIKKKRSTRKKYDTLSALIAVSEAAAEVVRNRFSQLPVKVIHDGVAISSGFSRYEAREKLGGSEGETVFASVGYFTSEKNIDLLLKCADLFLQKGPNFKLLLIGAIEEEMKELVDNHPAIIAPGIVAQADNYYAAFDCYLSTSTQEGLGSALLDAVVRGIPVVALDSGGSRDIFPENDPDHCADEESFLLQVGRFLQEGFPQERVNMRAETAQTDFSIAQLQTEHLSLYREILQKR